MRPIHALLILSLGLASCGEPERLTYQSGPIPLVATGPLFEGTNTAQGEWATGLEAFLVEQGHSLDQLRTARLVGATIAGADSSGLQGVRSVSVQWMDGATGMQQVAVRNPLPADSATVALTLATDQAKVTELVRSGTLTVVADMDLDADSDNDRHVIGSFTLELTLDR